MKQALHGLCAMFIWGDSITALLVISWNSLPGFVLKKSCCHFFSFFFSIFTWLTGWKNRGRPDLVLAHHHSSTAVSASLRWHVGHDTVLLLECCQSITHLQPSSLFLKIKPRKHIWYALLMCALMACLNLISEIRNVLFK